jgi:hypothetical protein
MCIFHNWFGGEWDLFINCVIESVSDGIHETELDLMCGSDFVKIMHIEESGFIMCELIRLEVYLVTLNLTSGTPTLSGLKIT